MSSVPPIACTGHIHYRSGYKYQLTHPYARRLSFNTGRSYQHRYFRLDGDLLLLYDGYAWDGPSGPTIDTDDFMQGAVVHDVGYQLIRLGVLPPEMRKLFDEELKLMCQQDGMWAIRRKFHFVILRLVGKGAATGPERPIRTSPKQYQDCPGACDPFAAPAA